ncbi:MAG: hypothetical protein IVW36_10225 [Dehalococcoidia bacterium]|nr:hypothetical protein [Dehalococcoidia bacterium]
MGTIIAQGEGAEAAPAEVRCPICGTWNRPLAYCRHVRWTFDQGGPLDFTRFAVETSAYRNPQGYTTRDIPEDWWHEHEEWIIERVLQRFAASDGYVFGELAHLDLLTLDVWRAFAPEPERRPIPRQ